MNVCQYKWDIFVNEEQGRSTKKLYLKSTYFYKARKKYIEFKVLPCP